MNISQSQDQLSCWSSVPLLEDCTTASVLSGTFFKWLVLRYLCPAITSCYVFCIVSALVLFRYTPEELSAARGEQAHTDHVLVQMNWIPWQQRGDMSAGECFSGYFTQELDAWCATAHKQTFMNMLTQPALCFSTPLDLNQWKFVFLTSALRSKIKSRKYVCRDKLCCHPVNLSSLYNQ